MSPTPGPGRPSRLPPRREYAGEPLAESDFAADPMTQFAAWFADAVARGVPEPDAVCLATASADGAPSSRMVLLKGWDARGFVVATSYRSRKGSELAANPRAALTFRWAAAERQVGVVGTVRRVSPAESDAIFAARPRGAQLAAWASAQSEVVPGRERLDERYAQAERRFAGGEVPRPRHWGGIRLVPDAVEFWQGRANRMHDRLRYRREGRRWVLERLAP